MPIEELEERYATLYATLQDQVKEIDGATDLLVELSRRCSLHVVSSAPTEEVAKVVSTMGWTDFFTSQHGFPELKSNALTSVARRRQISTREIVFVGDNDLDEVSADSVGCRAIRIGPSKRLATSELASSLGEVGPAIQRLLS